MKKRYPAALLPVLLAVLLLFASCNRLEELNIDPVNPTTTTIDRLFAGYLSLTFWGYDYWANHAKSGWMVWMQQISSTNNRGLQEFRQSELGRDYLWSFLYTDIFQTYRLMEQEIGLLSPELQAINQYRFGAMKILLFQYAAKVSDLYGAIPFSEAGRGLDLNNPIIRPKFDSQEAIYEEILAELTRIDSLYALQDPEQLTFQNPEDVIDLYYFNNWENWRRLCNSLRLRLAMRLSEVRPGYAEQQVRAVLDADLPLIETPEQHAVWDKNLSAYENRGLNDAHRFDEAQGIKSRASQRMWSQLASNTDDAGIFDPRARIFFSKNGFGQWAPIPSSPLLQEQENIQPDPLLDPDFPALYSILNPDFLGSRQTPERHFLSSEVAFLIAEAALRGWTNEDAEQWYYEGIRRSVNWYVSTWNTQVFGSEQIPTLSEEELQDIFDQPINAWDPDRGLELIITQKWIDFMLDPLEAYSDWRRTGYPELEPLQTASGATMLLPQRYVYPLSESIDNASNYQAAVAELPGGDQPSSEVWWSRN